MVSRPISSSRENVLSKPRWTSFTASAIQVILDFSNVDEKHSICQPTGYISELTIDAMRYKMVCHFRMLGFDQERNCDF